MPEYENIRIYPKTKNAVSSLAKKWEMTQVVFLEAAMEYFQKTGVNPKDHQVLSPAEELKKFRDTIISFMRRQEKDFIKPVFGRMDALIAIFMKYIEEEAPRKGDALKSELLLHQQQIPEDTDEGKIYLPEAVFNDRNSALANELERERTKLKKAKEYFGKVMDSIEVKSTGLQKKPVVELPMGEIKSIKEFLSRL